MIVSFRIFSSNYNGSLGEGLEGGNMLSWDKYYPFHCGDLNGIMQCHRKMKKSEQFENLKEKENSEITSCFVITSSLQCEKYPLLLCA